MIKKIVGFVAGGLAWSTGLSLANAQIQNQPVEVITATPLSSFSERSGPWPSVNVHEDTLKLEGQALSEALNAVPGIQSRDFGSPTVSIRGSAQADRVLQLYEGIPLNLADGFGASMLFIPTEAIGSVQIFKGPASVFYGTSAMAGALDYRMRIFERPAFRLSLADNTGLLGERNLFAVLPLSRSRGEVDQVWQLSLAHSYDPGEYRFQSVSEPISGRLDTNSRESTRVTLTGDITSGKWAFHPRLIFARRQIESPGSLQVPRISTDKYEGNLVSLTTEYRASDKNRYSLQISDIRTWGDNFDRAMNPSDSSTAVSRSAAQVSSSHLIFDRVRMQNFADIRNDSYSATFLNGNKYYAASFEAGQSYEVPLSPTLTLQPAYRYHLETGRFTKAVGLLRSETDLRTWMTYSEGFRVPSISDRFAQTSFYVGNSSLRPEQSESVEIGFVKENGRRFKGYFEGLTYGTAFFQTKYEDLIDTTASGGVFTSVNRGRASAQGIEASLGYSVSVWTFNLAYNYLETENRDLKTPLRLSPKHQITFIVGHQIGPVVIELENTYWSHYFDHDPMSGDLQRLPEWNSLDLTARTLGLMNWEISGGILNILDEPKELTLGFPEPQRKIFISALRYF